MRHIAPLLVLFMLSAPAAAQMYGPGYQDCGTRDTTVQIVECINSNAKTWDRRLNTAYKALQQRIDPSQAQPLKSAQRLWIQYRDANCGFYASADGSIRQVEAAECLRAMTQQRTCELDAASNMEGKVSPGCE